MLNACKEDIRRFLSHTSFEGTSSVVSSLPQPLPRTSNPEIPTIGKEGLAGSVVPPDIGGESVPSGLLQPSPPEMLFTLPEQVPARPPHADARSQFLGNLSSSVADLLSTGQGTVSTACQPDISQEFMTLMEDKFIDNCSLSFYKQNLYEYEQGIAAAVVKGRLRAHLPFWVEIEAPPGVLETIRSGYVIPFETIPPGVCLSNNRSALEHSDFVSSAVCDLLKMGLVSELLTPPTVINPLSVSVNSEGKPRLILDLRHVNSCIPKAKVRIEDWKVFLQYLSRGGYMYKFDLKSGYHHIDICRRHHQFLGFQWALGGARSRYFCFTVLPFGLSSAPYLFTKFFRPLVRYWRGLGIHLVLY